MSAFQDTQSEWHSCINLYIYISIESILKPSKFRVLGTSEQCSKLLSSRYTGWLIGFPIMDRDSSVQ